MATNQLHGGYQFLMGWLIFSKSRNYLSLMGQVGSLPCSQKQADGHHLITHESSPNPLNLYP
jgi:hypothetical protein